MEDKIVELTRFVQVSKAEMLANLLKSEGIDCYVRDCFMNQIYGGVDIGGVKIELLEKDLQRATEIMNDYGYSKTGEEGEEGEEYAEGEEAGFIDDSEVSEEAPEHNEIAEYEEAEEAEDTEEDEDAAKNAALFMEDYENSKAKLRRTMTYITFLILLLIGILIILNIYFKE